MYDDFFEATGSKLKPGEGTGEVTGGIRKGKRKHRGVRFVDEEVEKDEEDEAEEGEDRDVMVRMKGDLFDEDEDEPDEQSEWFRRKAGS